jgi:hypothetical protein
MRHSSRQAVAAGWILTALIGASVASGQEQFQLPPVSDNAALQYWQAFAMLPALDADQEKLLENWADAPLDDAVRKVLTDSQASLMFLHRGGKRRRCDWGLDYNDGVSLYLPHVAKARTLGRIAALDARRAFAEGQPLAAAQRAADMMALGRQIGGDYTMVSTLVCYAAENIVVDLLAPHVPELDAEYSKSVRMLEMLPPSPDLSHSVACEKQLGASISRQLREIEDRQKGAWREAWLGMASPDVPEALRQIESLDEVLRLLEEFQSVYDELAQLVTLPAKQFDEKYPEFAKRARAENPIAELLLPAMDKVIAAQRRTETRLASLLAGIAVAERGPTALAEIDDPFGDGPFAYREVEGGFELSSGLVHEGSPVTVRFGQGD